MELKVEQIDGDIAGLEENIRRASVAINEMNGALGILRNLRVYLLKPEPDEPKAEETLPNAGEEMGADA